MVDARIRGEVGPAAAQTEGLIGFYAGRRGVEPTPERAIVTVWESGAAHDAAAADATTVLGREELGGEVEVLPVAVQVLQESAAAPEVLRVFRGTTRKGQLEAYIEAVRNGTLEDLAAGNGPLALFLARGEGEEFVTVSAWTGWEPIQRATGGNIERPIATRNVAHLASGTAAHYEILPNSVSGLVRRPSLVD